MIPLTKHVLDIVVERSVASVMVSCEPETQNPSDKSNIITLRKACIFIQNVVSNTIFYSLIVETTGTAPVVD